MLKFHIISLFPEAFASYFGSSMIKRAAEAGHITIAHYNVRDFTDNKWKKADDRPYGGGPGMVMYAEPILKAVDSIKLQLTTKNSKLKTILFAPGGKQFTNSLAKGWSKKYTDVILICGHYEGVDARVKKILKAEEVSIGPYVLTGGELPAMVVVDAVARQIEGVLGDEDSIEENRIASGEMYTRPETFEYKGKKYKVPKVLLSGNHKEIEAWKQSKIDRHTK